MPLIDSIRRGLIGDRSPLQTPFGVRPLVYADYTASGRALDFIEDYIREQVLPWYANTHTETSFTGAQTTALREQARELVRSAVNGSVDDAVIFCGPGATAAINRLIDILQLRLPRALSRRLQFERSIPAAERPVVFVGPYEHHSNELPWRESIADVVPIPLCAEGRIDLAALEAALLAHAERPLRIGSFSAASNVTGIRSDVATTTALLKRHGALAFWDYAAAAPYLAIDMNAEVPLDAVFLSPHKFVGGPGTPGVLIAKRALLDNPVPAVVGGGTVSYVSPCQHSYVTDHERREEGGTPAIVESIRAGLVFKLQREVGVEEIERREQDFVARALRRLGECAGLEILGDRRAPRLSIFSLRFLRGERDLHYGFVVALFNDLFGIQVRGGCSCAGPYGHALLGLDPAYSRAIEQEVRSGSTLLRPGWVRLNFNYFIDEEEFEYLLRAVELVAEHGWRLLPYYRFDPARGTWCYQGERTELVADLGRLDFSQWACRPRAAPADREELAGLCEQAEQLLTQAREREHAHALELSPAEERLRWFLLPQEAARALAAERDCRTTMRHRERRH